MSTPRIVIGTAAVVATLLIGGTAFALASTDTPTTVRLAADGPLAGGQRSQHLLEDRALLGRDQVEQSGRRVELGGRVPQQLLAGPVPSDQRALEVADDDQRGSGVEHGIE